MDVTPEFGAAVQRVLRDVDLDGGEGADLVAVGVSRGDCLELLAAMLEAEPAPLSAAFLSVLTQMAVATGVWLERARWESP